MNQEQFVTSLELSKQLAEAGVKQDSLFYWYAGVSDKGEWKTLLRAEEKQSSDCYSAFTVGELGLMLPAFNYTIRDMDDVWSGMNISDLPIPGCIASTEADARAKILLDHIKRGRL